MYRQFEDMERIDCLEDERLKLLVENRELKQKLERKKKQNTRFEKKSGDGACASWFKHR